MSREKQGYKAKNLKGGEIQTMEEVVRKQLKKLEKTDILHSLMNYLIRRTNELLAEAGLPAQSSRETETADPESSLKFKLEILYSAVRDFYFLIDALAMIKYIITDAGFDGEQALWFRNTYVPEKVNTINLGIKDVADILRKLGEILKTLETITNQDETSPIRELVSRFRDLFKNLIMAYIEFVSTHGEYNVKGLLNNRRVNGQSIITWSESILSRAVPEQELKDFEGLQIPDLEQRCIYIFNFVVQLLQCLDKIGLTLEDCLKILYGHLANDPSTNIIDQIIEKVSSWMKTGKFALELKALIDDVKEKMNLPKNKTISFYELIQTLLSRINHSPENQLNTALNILQILLNTFWGQELSLDIQNVITQQTGKVQYGQFIVITTGDGNRFIIINLNGQGTDRPANSSFSSGGNNVEVAIIPIYGRLDPRRVAHEIMHSISHAIGKGRSNFSIEFWTQLVESGTQLVESGIIGVQPGTDGNQEYQNYYHYQQLRRMVETYRQGALCLSALHVFKEIKEKMGQTDLSKFSQEQLRAVINDLNKKIREIYEEYFGILGIQLPGKNLLTEILGGGIIPGLEYLESYLRQTNPSSENTGSQEGQQQEQNTLLERMILKFKETFGPGWMTKENAVAVLLATMIQSQQTENAAPEIELTFDQLKNRPEEAKKIIAEFRKQNLGQGPESLNIQIISGNSTFVLSQ